MPLRQAFLFSASTQHEPAPLVLHSSPVREAQSKQVPSPSAPLISQNFPLVPVQLHLALEAAWSPATVQPVHNPKFPPAPQLAWQLRPVQQAGLLPLAVFSVLLQQHWQLATVVLTHLSPEQLEPAGQIFMSLTQIPPLAPGAQTKPVEQTWQAAPKHLVLSTLLV